MEYVSTIVCCRGGLVYEEIKVYFDYVYQRAFNLPPHIYHLPLN